eukprot:scaffold311_cov173-Amphora_coffeaeformis.AAC.6
MPHGWLTDWLTVMSVQKSFDLNRPKPAAKKKEHKVKSVCWSTAASPRRNSCPNPLEILSDALTMFFPMHQIQLLFRPRFSQSDKLSKSRRSRKLRVFRFHALSTLTPDLNEESSVSTHLDYDEEYYKDISFTELCKRASAKEGDDLPTLRRRLKASTDPYEQVEFGTLLLFAVCGAMTNLKKSLEPIHHERIVTEMLAFGANIDAQDDLDRTPLFHAIESCNSNAAVVLIAKGANVNLANEDGETPFSKAREMSQWDVMMELINSRRLDRSALLQKRNTDDRMPLHDMCAHGSLASVKTLLEYYKVAGITSIAQGGTPSSIATTASQQDIVDYLTRYKNAPYYPATQHY